MLSGVHMTTKQLSEDPEAQVERRAVAGLAAPLVDLRIVDANMADVPHDGKTRGEIVTRAPWLTMGYLNDPAASEQLWAGGYLHTGDVATWDADGTIRIVDRIKDIIKSGGEWVSSIQVEDIISEKSGVTKAAVIAVKDAKWGERPMALVIVEPGFAGGSAEAAEEAVADQERGHRQAEIVFAGVAHHVLLAHQLALHRGDGRDEARIVDLDDAEVGEQQHAGVEVVGAERRGEGTALLVPGAGDERGVDRLGDGIPVLRALLEAKPHGDAPRAGRQPTQHIAAE